MRDIKFRGKKNGKWVYGGYAQHYDSNVFGIVTFASISDLDTYFKACGTVVDVGTINQFTGLNDSNGVEIYEGDIVAFTNARGIEYNTVVEFIDGAFWLTRGDDIETLAKIKYTKLPIKVIGNIFDNPELLKEEDDA